MPKSGLIVRVLIHENDEGKSNDNVAAANTHIPIQRAMKSQIFFICLKKKA